MFNSVRKMNVNGCMFSSVMACGTQTNKNKTGMICDRHLEDVFSMRVIEDVLVSSEGRTNVIKQVLTSDVGDNRTVLPFPFSLPNALPSPDPEFSDNGNTLCLDEKTVAHSVQTFIYNKSLSPKYCDDVIRAICDIIIMWISAGSINTPRSSGAMSFFLDFHNANKESFQGYWKGTQLYIYRDQTMVGFPITKLPLVYQALLCNVEIALYRHPNRASISIPPNLAFSVNSQNLRLFNSSPENRIYFMSGAATFASPLIVCGAIELTAGQTHHLFTRVSTGLGNFKYVRSPLACV